MKRFNYNAAMEEVRKATQSKLSATPPPQMLLTEPMKQSESAKENPTAVAIPKTSRTAFLQAMANPAIMQAMEDTKRLIAERKIKTATKPKRESLQSPERKLQSPETRMKPTASEVQSHEARMKPTASEMQSHEARMQSDVETVQKAPETKEPAAVPQAKSKKKRVRKPTEMRPITVRFSPEAGRTIKAVSAENNITQAELVRIAVAGQLNRYLGTVRIIDPDQGKEIKRAVAILCDTVSKIQLELNRIGVNYNQEIRLMNTEGKSTGNTSVLPVDTVTEIIKQYEDATREVGALLCRILA